MEYKSNSAKIISTIRDAANQAATRAAVVLQSAMKEVLTQQTSSGISKPGAGRVLGSQSFRYKRDSAGGLVRNKKGNQKRFKSSRNRYEASSPGSPPGLRTGHLRRSISVVPASAGRARVGTALNYGRWHEYGYNGKARNGDRFVVPARPWAWVSFFRSREAMKSAAQQVFSAKFAGGK